MIKKPNTGWFGDYVPISTEAKIEIGTWLRNKDENANKYIYYQVSEHRSEKGYKLNINGIDQEETESLFVFIPSKAHLIHSGYEIKL